jgi:predicted nucleotide-binding protein (sugar kinase/HSP70/actin superfamily)
MVVGLPRALLYYKYGTFWENFLKACGFDVIISPPTNRCIVQRGVLTAESEICLPVKVFFGHALEVASQVDYLFIPRVVKVEKRAYTCPKLLGLPDMLKGTVDVPPIISPLINAAKGWRSYVKSWQEAVGELGVSSSRVLWALLKASRAQRSFEKSQLFSGKKSKGKSQLKVGLAGHSYNLLDRYLSFDLVKKLRARGVEVLQAEEVPYKYREKAIKSLPKKLFWSYEKELVGAAFYWARMGLVDGVIFVNSFACGPDSLMQVVVEGEMEKFKLPVMSLVLDEHTSETGLVTRLEAFIDMIWWSRKR